MKELIKIKSLEELTEFVEDMGKVEKIDPIQEFIFNSLRTRPASLSYLTKNIRQVPKIKVEENLQKLMEQNYVKQCEGMPYFSLTKDGENFWGNYAKYRKRVAFTYHKITIVLGGTYGDDVDAPARK